MLDSALAILTPMISFFETKFPLMGTMLAYLIFFMPIVSMLIELIEFLVQMTESKADDEFAAKIRGIWDKVMPIVEILPHSNLPLSPILMKISEWVMKGVAAVKGAVGGWVTKK